MHNPGAHPRKLPRARGADPRSSAACRLSSHRTAHLEDLPRVGTNPSQSGRRSGEVQIKGGRQRSQQDVPGEGEGTGRCRNIGRQGLGRSVAGAAPAPPGRRRGPLPHRSPLQRKTWGPGAAASGGICRSPARGRARPGGGAGSAPPPRRLPPPSPFPSFPRAARPLLPPPPPSFPHPVCVPLPLRLAGRLGRPRPEREAGALAAAATRGCGGEQDPRPRGGPASGPGTRGLPLHPPAEGRGAWPRRGVEEVRASRGRAAGPLLERRQGGPQPPSLPLASPPQPSGGPRGSRTGRDLAWPGQRQGRG